jgi:hypothetical protein
MIRDSKYPEGLFAGSQATLGRPAGTGHGVIGRGTELGAIGHGRWAIGRTLPRQFCSSASVQCSAHSHRLWPMALLTPPVPGAITPPLGTTMIPLRIEVALARRTDRRPSR